MPTKTINFEFDCNTAQDLQSKSLTLIFVFESDKDSQVQNGAPIIWRIEPFSETSSDEETHKFQWTSELLLTTCQHGPGGVTLGKNEVTSDFFEFTGGQSFTATSGGWKQDNTNWLGAKNSTGSKRMLGLYTKRMPNDKSPDCIPMFIIWEVENDTTVQFPVSRVLSIYGSTNPSDATDNHGIANQPTLKSFDCGRVAQIDLSKQDSGATLKYKVSMSGPSSVTLTAEN